MSLPEPPLLPGAEARFHAGGRAGALVLHGFTGTPATMAPLTDALVAAGFTVSSPRLPGHGTTVEDMATTGWADWSAEVERAHLELAARCERVVVAGLSMGGTLACWLVARHPEIAGLVTINAAVLPADPDLRAMVQAMLDAGEVLAPGVGADLADPDAVEVAYDEMPLAGLLSLWDAVEELQDAIGSVTGPALVVNSAVDHVVEPVAADHLASLLGGPVERLVLERSYHVATLDLDRDLLAAAVVGFARKVTAD
jgi:carboxylesterase